MNWFCVFPSFMLVFSTNLERERKKKLLSEKINPSIIFFINAICIVSKKL
jgi:hypothetical protein